MKDVTRCCGRFGTGVWRAGGLTGCGMLRRQRARDPFRKGGEVGYSVGSWVKPGCLGVGEVLGMRVTTAMRGRGGRDAAGPPPRRFPGDQRLQAAVAAVAHPAVQARRRGAGHQPVAVADPLHLPVMMMRFASIRGASGRSGGRPARYPRPRAATGGGLLVLTPLLGLKQLVQGASA